MFKYDIYKYNDKYYVARNIEQDIFDYTGETVDIDLYEIDLKAIQFTGKTESIHTSKACEFFNKDCIKVGFVTMGITSIMVTNGRA